jgi:hypothetical protein
MLKDLSVRECGLWAALWEIDPWGEERADLRNAITSYVIAEQKRQPKVRSTPYKPTDFMPYAQKDEKALSRDLSSRLKAVFKKQTP